MAHACLQTATLALLLTGWLGPAGFAQAAPGNLAQLPLFLSTAVAPNIFFVLDDARAMDSEVLRSVGAAAAHPTFADDGLLSPSPSSEEEVLEHCVGYNLLAFDPAVSYGPWDGADAEGQAFADLGLTLAAARDDPYRQDTRVSLSDRLYFPWTDSDEDGEYDLGECPRPSPADFGGTISAADCPAAGCVAASSLEAAAQASFANWYSFHRKREYVLKQAVSAAIEQSSARVGLATLNDASGVSTEVADMSDPANPGFCGTGTNKDCMLQRLLQIDSAQGGETPLRRALNEAGRYFAGSGHQHLGSVASPILDASAGGACQQNFAVLVAGSYWNQPWSGSHGDADSDGNSPWDGGAQADGAPSPEPTTCDPPGGWWPAAEPFRFPTAVGTLADVAMHYYETDLSALDNLVAPTPGVDENPQQHMVTFAFALGMKGQLSSDPGNRTDPFPWPPVCPNTTWTVDDMRHAAWNGHGRFVSSVRPTSISETLPNAVASLARRQASSSAMAANASGLSADALLFRASFDASDWSGDLAAYRAAELVADMEEEGSLSIAPVWSAAEALDGLSNTQALQRTVLTLGEAGDGVAAAAWAELTPEQRADLRINSSGGQDPDSAGEARLAYLLGDRSCEVGGEGACASDVNADGEIDGRDKSLRRRGSRLGDIVNSNPVVVGIPELGWPSTAPFPDGSGTTQSYTDFKNDLIASPREEVVYVGGNDGMLHGFRTSDGREVLAYLPQSLASTTIDEGYHYLSDPRYAHRYYVDRTPAISDVHIDSDAGGARWRTIAVGGLGAGGRGLYALEISNPDDFSTENATDLVLWELTADDDPELGYTLGAPVIAMMNNGQWAAVAGSGYNDSGDIDAHLFIIFLEAGIDGAWTAGSDYIRIAVPDPGLEERNGLSSPAVADLDGNGTADRIYAGDLLGNLWAFDVSGSDPAGWGVANGQEGTQSEGPAPLFTAVRDGLRQPITVKPAISNHPTQGDAPDNLPNVMLYFGTGQYLADTDLASTDVQSFYGVWDRGALSLGRSELQAQTFEAGFSDNQVLTDNAVDWGLEFGWYIDLPSSAERVVADPGLRESIVLFTSFAPSAEPCTGGGASFLYAVDMETGGRPGFAPFDTDDNGIVDLNDLATPEGGGDERYAASRKTLGGAIASRPQVLGDRVFTGLSDGSLDMTALFELDRLDKGRLSWGEISPF